MLTQAVESYLAVRRAAGFELRSDGAQLQNFARFSNQKKKRFVCAQTAIDWAALAPSVAHRARRLGLVIRLARYLRAEDPRHEIPPEGIFGKDSRLRPTPIYPFPRGHSPSGGGSVSPRSRGFSVSPHLHHSLRFAGVYRPSCF
jgi:hypothetical protein